MDPIDEKLAAVLEAINQQLEERDRQTRKYLDLTRQINRGRYQKEKEAHKRNREFSIAAGVVGAILGIVMLAFIFSIWSDMDRMADNMDAMSVSMQQMQASMKNMDSAHMKSMSEDMLAMKTAMVDMNQSMKTMSGNFQIITDKMGTIERVMDDMGQRMTPGVVSMSQDMSEMNQSVKNMNYDTGMMRTGVNHMANDTGAMSHPFRFMNGFTPW